MDERDPTDNETYLYVTFSMGLPYDIHIMKIRNKDLGSKMSYNWHMMLSKPATAPQAFSN